jgi:hypothetical protein
MTPYEIKKLQVDLKRVILGKEDQELRVLELQDTIARIQKSIDVSIASEKELEEKLKAALAAE